MILLSLWLPILLSAVFVFIASSVIHMALPWHKSDFKKVPEEDKVRAALRPFAIPPGDYMMPMCKGSEMNSPAYKAKLEAGPNQLITVLPNRGNSMGPVFVQWFIYLLAVATGTAWVAVQALPPAAPATAVFRIVAGVSFLAYAGALWPQSIWLRKSWATTVKSTVDGAIYALVTAGTFVWGWPQ